MDWFKYLNRAFQVVGLMMTVLPEILKDGKITVDEIAELFMQLAKICNWDIVIDVPASVQGQVLGIKK